MTLLVALVLATAVKLRPVLASPVTSGKKRLTVLTGTTTLRGSTVSDAFPEPSAGDGDCPFALSKRDSITAVNTAANFISVGPFRMSLIFTLAY
jgi:hypothetical protein